MSPDGRGLAYVSDDTKRGEIYVQPFPDADAAKPAPPMIRRKPPGPA